MTLLKYELKNNSIINKIKYEKGKKKRAGVALLIGKILLYLFLMAFVFLITMLLFRTDSSNTDAAILTTLVISATSFFFTLIKSNGYMFAYKEYDMLTALPIKSKTIASAKFLYMYVMNLRMTLSIMFAAMLSSLIFGKLSILSALIWLIISFFVPMIPMIIATALGSLISGVGGRFRYTRAVRIFLMIILTLLSFSSRFIIEWLFRTYGLERIAFGVSSALTGATIYYPPAYWISKAVMGNVLYMLLFLAVSIGLFEIFFVIIGKYYRQINSRLKINAYHKEFTMSKQKRRSVVNSIALNEFLRFKGSTNYFVNAGFGIILVLILSIVAIFINPDKIITSIFRDAPITSEMTIPAIPFIVHFFVGMVPTTTISYSLESKQLWILKSLPVTAWDMARGKMRFNNILFIPAAIISNLILSLRFGGTALDIMINILAGIVFCLFATVAGMAVGLRFPLLEWDNEIEPIKKTPAVAVYIFPQIFITMLLAGGAFFINYMKISHLTFTGMVAIIIGILSLVSLLSVKRKTR